MKFLKRLIDAVIANRVQQAEAYRKGYRYY